MQLDARHMSPLQARHCAHSAQIKGGIVYYTIAYKVYMTSSIQESIIRCTLTSISLLIPTYCYPPHWTSACGGVACQQQQQQHRIW